MNVGPKLNYLVTSLPEIGYGALRTWNWARHPIVEWNSVSLVQEGQAAQRDLSGYGIEAELTPEVQAICDQMEKVMGPIFAQRKEGIKEAILSLLRIVAKNLIQNSSTYKSLQKEEEEERILISLQNGLRGFLNTKYKLLARFLEKEEDLRGFLREQKLSATLIGALGYTETDLNVDGEHRLAQFFLQNKETIREYVRLRSSFEKTLRLPEDLAFNVYPFGDFLFSKRSAIEEVLRFQGGKNAARTKTQVFEEFLGGVKEAVDRPNANLLFDTLCENRETLEQFFASLDLCAPKIDVPFVDSFVSVRYPERGSPKLPREGLVIALESLCEQLILLIENFREAGKIKDATERKKRVQEVFRIFTTSLIDTHLREWHSLKSVLGAFLNVPGIALYCWNLAGLAYGYMQIGGTLGKYDVPKEKIEEYALSQIDLKIDVQEVFKTRDMQYMFLQAILYLHVRFTCYLETQQSQNAGKGIPNVLYWYLHTFFPKPTQEAPKKETALSETEIQSILERVDRYIATGEKGENRNDVTDELVDAYILGMTALGTTKFFFSMTEELVDVALESLLKGGIDGLLGDLLPGFLGEIFAPSPDQPAIREDHRQRFDEVLRSTLRSSLPLACQYVEENLTQSKLLLKVVLFFLQSDDEHPSSVNLQNTLLQSLEGLIYGFFAKLRKGEGDFVPETMGWGLKALTQILEAKNPQEEIERISGRLFVGEEGQNGQPLPLPKVLLAALQHGLRFFVYYQGNWALDLAQTQSRPYLLSREEAEQKKERVVAAVGEELYGETADRLLRGKFSKWTGQFLTGPQAQFRRIALDPVRQNTPLLGDRFTVSVLSPLLTEESPLKGELERVLSPEERKNLPRVLALLEELLSPPVTREDRVLQSLERTGDRFLNCFVALFVRIERFVRVRFFAPKVEDQSQALQRDLTRVILTANPSLCEQIAATLGISVGEVEAHPEAYPLVLEFVRDCYRNPNPLESYVLKAAEEFFETPGLQEPLQESFLRQVYNIVGRTKMAHMNHPHFVYHGISKLLGVVKDHLAKTKSYILTGVSPFPKEVESFDQFLDRMSDRLLGTFCVDREADLKAYCQIFQINVRNQILEMCKKEPALDFAHLNEQLADTALTEEAKNRLLLEAIGTETTSVPPEELENLLLTALWRLLQKKLKAPLLELTGLGKGETNQELIPFVASTLNRFIDNEGGDHRLVLQEAYALMGRKDFYLLEKSGRDVSALGEAEKIEEEYTLFRAECEEWKQRAQEIVRNATKNLFSHVHRNKQVLTFAYQLYEKIAPLVGRELDGLDLDAITEEELKEKLLTTLLGLADDILRLPLVFAVHQVEKVLDRGHPLFSAYTLLYGVLFAMEVVAGLIGILLLPAYLLVNWSVHSFVKFFVELNSMPEHEYLLRNLLEKTLDLLDGTDPIPEQSYEEMKGDCRTAIRETLSEILTFPPNYPLKVGSFAARPIARTVEKGLSMMIQEDTPLAVSAMELADKAGEVGLEVKDKKYEAVAIKALKIVKDLIW